MQAYRHANMKKILIIAVLIFVVQLQAQVRIGETEALATAELFLNQQSIQQTPQISLSEVIYSKDSNQPNLFVFSMEPKGFVIISALDEVLAYSWNSILPTSTKLPNHIIYWLDLYNERTDYLLHHPEQYKKPQKSQKSVEPLLNSIWGQGCFHNEACPLETSGPCGHVSAGCVAIAMAQIMYYHKQPLMGCGTMSYSCPPYGNLSANFGQTSYHWEEMTDTLHESNPAVAELISHCGISVRMQYGAHQSSASNEDAYYAFCHFFSYFSSTFLHKSNYSDEEWCRMIMEDLDNLRPVYYTGSSRLGSHAFVCDGYDNNGMFHFNFGWDAVADGYYTLDDPFNFSNHQAIIRNICPASDISINSDEHGLIYVAPNGTGDGSSWAQATCDLQSAIFKSHLCDNTIWVKEGRYTGNPNDDYAFLLLQHSNLYGGFCGDEPYNYDLSLRDFEAHPSILDGNHSQGVINVFSNFDDRAIVIDGFTIQNGNAFYGGGILSNSNIQIRNCKFCYNCATFSGGGFSNLSSAQSANSFIEDCEFFGNDAKNNGGAVDDHGNSTYHRCQFYDNYARKNGGAIYCSINGQQSQLINCLINNNIAKNGGGLACYGQGPTVWSSLINNNTAETGGGCYLNGEGNLFNCTIVKNEARTNYGGVYTSDPSLQSRIRNCIIWGNINQSESSQIGPHQSYSYCAVQNDTSGSELNFDAKAENDGESPGFYIRFKNPNTTAGSSGQGGDYRLQTGSLCVGRGDNIANYPETDLDGNPRLKHGNVDLGAYESNSIAYIINAYTCEDSPFIYNGTPFPDIGTYSFLHPGITYDSLVILQLQNEIVTMIKEICEGEIYVFFGTLLYETGHYSTTIDCITYELELIVKPMPVISMEEEICESETFDFFGTPIQESGLYSTIIDCVVYELDLTVKSPSINYLEEEICMGEAYNFYGNLLTTEGIYSTSFPDCQIYELSLTVNPLPPICCSNDTLIEFGHPVVLSASGAENYLWSTGDTTKSITVFPKKDMTYTVTGFSQYGCSAKASVKIQVKKDNEEIILYPNPANDKVEIYKPMIDEVEILRLTGECICHINAHREVVELDIRDYANGVYIVHVSELNNHYYKKLVIKH